MLWFDGLLFSSSIYILWCLKNATHYCGNYREQNSIQFPDIQWEISSLGSASLFKHLELVFGIHFQYFLFSPCVCVYVYLSLFLVVHGKLSLLTEIKRAVLHVCGINSGRNSFWIKNFLVFHSFIRCKQNCCGFMPSFSFNNKLSISSKISKNRGPASLNSFLYLFSICSLEKSFLRSKLNLLFRHFGACFTKEDFYCAFVYLLKLFSCHLFCCAKRKISLFALLFDFRCFLPSTALPVL